MKYKLTILIILSFLFLENNSSSILYGEKKEKVGEGGIIDSSSESDRENNYDALYFSNGYIMKGNIIQGDAFEIKFRTKDNEIKRYPQEIFNYICINSVNQKCKTYSPTERFIASFFIPGLGQFLGKKNKEGKWMMGSTIPILYLTYLVYNTNIPKINENNQVLKEKINLTDASKQDRLNTIKEYSNQIYFALSLSFIFWAISVGHAYQNSFTPIESQKQYVKQNEISFVTKNKIKTLSNNLEGNFYLYPSLDFKNNLNTTGINSNNTNINLGYKLKF